MTWRLGVHPGPGAAPPRDTKAIWYPYRAWGYAPRELLTEQQQRVEDLFGPLLWLLYIGITCRGGPVRWDEHFGFGQGKYKEPPKDWAQYVKVCELDDSRGFEVKREAEAWEAVLIDREQPLGNTAGKGKLNSLRRGQPPRRMRWLDLRTRAAYGRLMAPGAVWGYLVPSLPRLTTGAFPASGLEWAAWAGLALALVLWARYVTSRYWMGARS